MVKELKYKRKKCPLCKSLSGCLSDGVVRRYYCLYCSIEFTMDSNGGIESVYEIKASGTTEEIYDWENYKLYD
ncbi:MAG: hypothetical protein ACRCX2_06275 [Paraclostridium sp.]